jgi:hypothetical protein
LIEWLAALFMGTVIGAATTAIFAGRNVAKLQKKLYSTGVYICTVVCDKPRMSTCADCQVRKLQDDEED